MATAAAGTRAGALDIEIKQGSTFSLPLTWRDEAGAVVDASLMTARLHVRERKDSPTTLIELTTENGRIAVAATSPNVTLSITATDTAALDFDEGSPAVFDLEMVSGAVVTPLIAGRVRLVHEVSQ